ncbi:MAG: hypothetical protein ACYTEU_08865 [Planctomycetota bacterium]
MKGMNMANASTILKTARHNLEQTVRRLNQRQSPQHARCGNGHPRQTCR